MFQKIIDFIFPKDEGCLLCGGRMEDFSPFRWCGSCLSELLFLKEDICPLCGKKLIDTAGQRGFKLRRPTRLCFDCSESERHFNLARAPVLYTGFIKDVIHRFKFGGESRIGKALGWLAAQSILRVPEYFSADVLIPVPIDRERLLERGYNQSELIAGEIGSITGISVGCGVLVKARITSRQSSLGREDRIRNVSGAFRVVDSTPVAGKRIIVVDDLITTGSTLNECAKVLKESGASKVYALACAAGEWVMNDVE